MNMIYLFDVDGTLTPARQEMKPDFAVFFERFVNDYPVYLISGSDMPKIQAQVPKAILDSCKGVFVCSGAELWIGETCVEKRHHEFPKTMIDIIQAAIDQSPYPLRVGNHIEPRTGMINVSIVGRSATHEERMAYFEWDETAGERVQLAQRIAMQFPEYEVTIGGQISIDIVPKGLNKSVAKDAVLLRNAGAALCFFGDRMDEGGNDKPLADVLIGDDSPHRAIAVEGYNETWKALEDEVSYCSDVSVNAVTG